MSKDKIVHKMLDGPIEHILTRPGMYIGDIETNPANVYVVEDKDNFKIVEKTINFNPGFCKIFDEIITNCSDYHIRTGDVKNIKVDIFKDHIVIENNGSSSGIPIKKDKEHKIYVPEMIFGHLYSGSNFDDENVERVWGGLHGLGAKLTNIYSKKFILETSDGKKKYTQIFQDNLNKIGKPKITKSTKHYTKITYYPDFERFGMKEITDDIESFLIKRIIDIAVYCPTINVYYNKKKIPIRNFKDYMNFHLNDEEMYYSKLNNDWEIGISESDDGFKQISLVNGLSTILGGTHVNYITNKLIKEIVEHINKKHKKLNIKQSDIKNKLFLFLNSKVVNPLFDTQTKESLKSKINVDIEINQTFIRQLLKSDIIESIIDSIKIREKSELKKINNKRIKIKKLEDANFAGTSKSKDCLCFLAEGDSAAATVLTGFSSTGRNHYGCLTLKGKISNVREIATSKIKENEEILNIVNCFGLEFGKKYKNIDDLRYGKLVIATDSDVDGTHIKGLIINLFEVFWPELLKLDFIYEFVTPIIKIEKNKDYEFFYKLEDYKKWKKRNLKGWFVTYYKGLGTIEPHESKMFFKDIDKHLIRFHYDMDSETRDIINMVFNKKRTDEKKEWMLRYDPNNVVDKFTKKTTFFSFFDDEFIEFSIDDVYRSLPSLVDGLKTSQRKVLYTLFKANYKNKIKVSNLTGAVMEKSSYHHGVQSMESTIISMAQDLMGTNNINLLQPLGNFGTRRKGGKDAASGRYTFTMLSDITRTIFMEDDDPLLNYLDDDGIKIEPDYYVPVLPMCLINGSEGIGSGWSTFLPNYDIKDVANNILSKLSNKKSKKLHPKYKNFKGEIIFDDTSEKPRYITRGLIEKVNMSTLNITELPIGMWNIKYYDILDDLIDKKIIKSYRKNETDTEINIRIDISRESLKSIENDLHSVFKLESYLTMSNINLINEKNIITKYNDVEDIINDFIKIRKNFYNKRKNHQLKELENKINIIDNKIKFLDLILNNKLKINNRKKSDIESDLIKKKFDKHDGNFNYLLNIPIVNLTSEKLIELNKLFENTQKEYEILYNTDIIDIWKKDLKNILKKLN